MELISRANRGGIALTGRSPVHISRALIAAAALAAAALVPQPAATATREGSGSVVAQAKGSVVHLYRSPHAVVPYRALRNPNADGAPLVFLVKARRYGWELVYLPSRPNGSVAWIRDREVTLSLDPYKVIVYLHAHLLVALRGKQMILREPAGVGRSVLPTPMGTYYIVELLKQPDRWGLYGPYAFGLSAHSNVLYSFGGGPGQIGIHGTNEPWALGADVSHGCVRISNAAITRLARLLPLGTPVEIRP